MILLDSYFTMIRERIKRILEEERDNLQQASEAITEAIINDKLIHVFGTGHSMLIAEELFLRAGGLVPVNAILDKNLSIQSGIASTMNERTHGLAKKLIRKYGVSRGDVLIVISVSGINAAPVEAAMEGKKLRAKTIAITSIEASKVLKPRNEYGKRLYEVADIVIDMKVPPGDAVIKVNDFEQKVAPISTILGAFIANSLVILTCSKLLERGIKPPVWLSGNLPDSDRINMRYVDKYLGKIAHLGVESLIQSMKSVEKAEETKPIEFKSIVIYGDIITPFNKLVDGAVLIRNGKIIDIGYKEDIKPRDAKILDFSGHYIVPGFIDIHVHGCEGSNAFDGTIESLRDMAIKLAKHGVTSFLPTAATLPEEQLIKIASNVASLMKENYAGAEILGLNIEGPFVSPEKKGAMIIGFMRKPNIEEVEAIYKASEGKLRIMTIAPELENGIEVIKWLSSHSVIPSLGHTNATYDIAIKAFDSGAMLASHLFNAMRPIHHRDPGVIVAALDREDVYVELIADGIHVDPSVIDLVIRSKGFEKVIIVSDATPLAGLPDGEYTFPGFPKITIKNRKAYLPDGTLAGSTLTLDNALRNLLRWGIPLEKALMMLSTNQARLLGLRKGLIKPGYDSDISILNKKFEVVATLIGDKFIDLRKTN